ncbi:MAG TPA: Nif3-like dinuclear metal center hexameric protein [Clostridiales bacterium]|nr:Nif3-like dinuclear metal center hexameric protein [Clostridiales bacterium]
MAPPELAEPWDNVGLIIGSEKAAVNRVMVTLDITADVLKDAMNKNVDLIISHHPVLFHSIKSINDCTAAGAQLLSLLRSGISVYTAHTNLDKAREGTDDTLAELLGLIDVRPLKTEADPLAASRPSFGRIGYLPEKVKLQSFLESIKTRLRTRSVDYIGDPGKEIKVVASCAGAGGDLIETASKKGADLFITGEVKYHEALPVLDGTMALAAMGHYETENPAMARLIQRLQNAVYALQYKIEVIPSIDYGIYFRRRLGE